MGCKQPRYLGKRKPRNPRNAPENPEISVVPNLWFMFQLFAAIF
jgi:hypothetical protein